MNAEEVAKAYPKLIENLFKELEKARETEGLSNPLFPVVQALAVVLTAQASVQGRALARTQAELLKLINTQEFALKKVIAMSDADENAKSFGKN